MIARVSPIAVLLCLVMACGPEKSGSDASDPTAQASELNQACMEYIMAVDDSLGTARNHATDSLPIHLVIANYTDKLESLDYSNCPDEFSAAFHSHIEAWRSVIPVAEKYPDLRGEIHILFDEIQMTEDSTAVREGIQYIWDTWQEVEQARGAGDVVE